MDIYFRLLLGHLVGDYLFQTNKMAHKKAQSGREGLLWCAMHAAVYTACVCLFLWTAKPLVIGLIFFSHWPLERYGLGAKWVRYINGLDVSGAFKTNNPLLVAEAFFVPIVVDNTLHLVLMWPIVRFLC